MLMRRLMPLRHKALFVVIYVVARLLLGVAPILLLGVVLPPIMSLVLFAVVLIGVVCLARVLGWYEPEDAAATDPVYHPVQQMAPTPPAPAPAIVHRPATTMAPPPAPTPAPSPTAAPVTSRAVPVSVVGREPSSVRRTPSDRPFGRWSPPQLPSF